MNYQLFQMINGLAGKNHILDKIMVDISKYGFLLFIAVIVVIFTRGLVKKQLKDLSFGFKTFLFTVLNLVIGMLISSVYFENRPFVSHAVNLLYSHVSDASFPSDHALGTFSIALCVLFYERKTGIVLLIFSLLIGFSRVFVGHHYPFDVLGAFAICIITYLIFNRYLSRFSDFVFKKLTFLFKF